MKNLIFNKKNSKEIFESKFTDSFEEIKKIWKKSLIEK